MKAEEETQIKKTVRKMLKKSISENIIAKVMSLSEDFVHQLEQDQAIRAHV